MKRFKNILLVLEPVDDQEDVINRAAELALNNGARVTIARTVEELPTSATGGYADIILDHFRNELEANRKTVADRGVDCDTMLLHGVSFIEVIRQVLRGGHDLIMKPAQNEDGWGAKLFGSTDMHLIRKAPVPVWVMKAGSSAKFERIVAAIDPSREDEITRKLNTMIMQLSTSMARSEGAELHIVHFWRLYGESILRGRAMTKGAVREIDEMIAQEESQHRQRFDALMSEHDFAGIQCKVHLEKGEPRYHLPELTAKLKADLVIMGTTQRSDLAGFLIGSTAEEVMGKIRCSMLATKPEGFQTPVKIDS